MSVIPVPADVATGVQRFLRDRGFNAMADVPLDRGAGLVRVSRVGGTIRNQRQEEAKVLVEVWENGQQASFLLARRVWKEFAKVSREDSGAFPGLYQYDTVPGVPVEYPDPYAEALSRHQFTVDMLVRFDEERE
ncbi:hypothetical protein INS90_10105 [Trueperella pecoris]|uniref:Uncharacterized protein n=1 Tax=Trueperella pecoris TaxID=2733571 RepID=A0A7M1QZR8_9ACTO|nr:hypothetical protein [Trueperella pecoris]QOR47582.1 hypothetical protein INS90_10105 [Trueperella pecoris]